MPDFQTPIFPLIDTKKLAERLGISAETVEKRRAYYPETLPAHYAIFGRTIRYSAPEVEAWIASAMNRAPGAAAPVQSATVATPDGTRSPLRDTQWLALALGVSVSCIEKRRSSDPQSLPPFLKTGNRVRFLEIDVLAWLARNRVAL